MANKSFEIQESKLRLGGVDLEAGNTGVVIPGVTRAASFRVEEVEDTGDQTYQFTPNSEVVVIDAALYEAIVSNGNTSVFANYEAYTDDEGYIDELDVLGRGNYTQPQSVAASTNDMYAYKGTASASDRPIVPEDWIQIPFRPKMRAGNVETIGGGGGTDTENVEFSNNVVQGSGWELGLSPGADFTSGEYTNFENGPEFGPQYFRVRGGDNYEHLHFDTTDNSKFDLYVGDDAKYFKLSKNGQAVIGTEMTTEPYDRHTWTFGTDGVVTFPNGTKQSGSLEPQLTKIDNKVQLKGTLEMGTNPGGSVSTLDSDQNTYVWFNSATGDSNGNKYAVGSDDNGNSFLVSYNPDGSLRWKYTFNDVEINGNTYQVYPYTIKYNTDGAGQFIYVGFDASGCTGAIVFDVDGLILNTWAWSVTEGSSLDHYSLEVDSTTGNPIIAGRAYGEWNLFESVPVVYGLIEDGILNINRVTGLNNITNVYPWDTSKWNIDIDGTSNWYQPSRINAFVGVPITTVTGVGGARSLAETTSYVPGAFTVDNSGPFAVLNIYTPDWTATSDLNAILAHGVGQNYNVVYGAGMASVFQTTGSWVETVPGSSNLWTVQGTLQTISGDPLTTGANILSMNYGTSALVNVYYRINEDGTSDYDGIEINTPGTGYAQGDQAVVPGELLGGTNLVSTTASAWITQGGPFSMSLIYAKSTYPDLGTTVQQGWLANGGGLFNAVITSIDSIDYNGTTPAWSINLGVPASSYDGSSDVTFNNAGNDLALTLYPEWNYAALNGGRPIQNTIRFLMDQPLTGTNFNVRMSTGDQAFIITPNWYTTIGDSSNQEITSISLDKNNGILYAIGDFNTPNQNDYPVIAIDYESGNIIWQKNFDDDTGWVGNASVIADGANSCVYVPFENDNGQACVIKLDSGGNLVWAVKFLDNSWDERPQGAIDSNGDLILVGSYNIYNPTVDDWADEMFFTKLSKTDGSQLWANSLTRNTPQRNDVNFNYDVDNNWVNIVNDVVYVGGYTRDLNNNYDVGLAVAVPADGSGLGDYQGWTYHAYTGDIGVNNIAGDMSFNNTNYQNINQLVITPMILSLSMAADQPGWSTYTTAIGGGSKVKFEDGSELKSAGIARFSKDGGNTSRTLSADMNGKFLYYDNSNNNNNSWLYIPSNAEVELPIGFTVTVAIGNLNGYSIYVGNDGNGDVVIYHAGSSDGANNYWTFGNNGNPGIYTIMKVDTNTWMLAGPDVQID